MAKRMNTTHNQDLDLGPAASKRSRGWQEESVYGLGTQERGGAQPRPQEPADKPPTTLQATSGPRGPHVFSSTDIRYRSASQVLMQGARKAAAAKIPQRKSGPTNTPRTPTPPTTSGGGGGGWRRDQSRDQPRP